MKTSIDTTAETKITAILLLRVYQRAIALGTQISPGIHRLEGLTVQADPDGYTVSINDGSVTARLMFHNKIAIEGGSERTLALFRNRLEAVAK